MSALTTTGSGLLKVSRAALPASTSPARATEAGARPAPKTSEGSISQPGWACRISCRNPAMNTMKAAMYSVSTSLVVIPMTLFWAT